MKISGRSIAYVLILLIAFAVGGFTFVGAQGFVEQLPVPVEENGIVEVVKLNKAENFTGADCAQIGLYRTLMYEVPFGKRLIVEHVTAAAWSDSVRRARTPARIEMWTTPTEIVTGQPYAQISQIIAFATGFPVSGGGPITTYADQSTTAVPFETVPEAIFFNIYCPRETGINDVIHFRGSIIGRLVPYPHPATIPTATPPP